MTAIVIFDGVCNLCTGSVQFILRHERAATLRFASVQSAPGVRLMRELGLDPLNVETFVLIENGAAFVRSEAALRIALHLRQPWRALSAARVVPRFLRDRVYDLVARNRYRWFGRRELCMVPGPAVAARFLAE